MENLPPYMLGECWGGCDLVSRIYFWREKSNLLTQLIIEHSSEKCRATFRRIPRASQRAELTYPYPRSQNSLLSDEDILKPEKESTRIPFEQPRSHPLYASAPRADGFYQCPFDQETKCSHKPTTQKFAYA